MGTIERYWDDVIIYYVEFSALDGRNNLRRHRKTLAIKDCMSEKEVEDIVRSFFDGIEEVLAVDILTEGLLLKGTSNVGL